MSSYRTDEEIILSYKNGDKEAFKELIDRYTTSLYNFTARLANKNDAPDIIQEVFIKVWKNIHNFNIEKASFKTWIFTIAKNTTTDYLRKRRNLLFSDMDKENPDEGGSFSENIKAVEILPDEIIQKLQDTEFLNKTLLEIRPEYREVLILHYQEEMTFEEIGKILKKPLNTVKSQHRRAIMELREILS